MCHWRWIHDIGRHTLVMAEMSICQTEQIQNILSTAECKSAIKAHQHTPMQVASHSRSLEYRLFPCVTTQA